MKHQIKSVLLTEFKIVGNQSKEFTMLRLQGGKKSYKQHGRYTKVFDKNKYPFSINFIAKAVAN